MLGYRNTPANPASYLSLVALLLLSAGVAGAQTPIGSANKVPVGARATEPASSSTSISTTASSPTDGAATAASDPAKSEASPVDAKAEPPIPPPPPPPRPTCKRTIKANVVALSQPFMLNRLGAAVPDGLIFALKKDTVAGSNPLRLKDTKRARPLVLRANVGDCLRITFTNAIPASKFGTTTEPAASTGTQEVSLHVQGMEWVNGSQDDGSFVGKNNSSLASANPAPTPMPPQTRVYTLHAKEEGTFLLYTMGDSSSGEGIQLERGLFGALNVQPEGAEWYRSQVTADDLALATYKTTTVPPGSLTCPNPPQCTLTLNGKTIQVLQTPGNFLNTLDNHPLINYDAKYPGPGGLPVLKMLDATKNIVHSDLTAIITGPNAGRFPGTTGVNNPEPACNAENNPALKDGKVDPLFCGNPASPDRKQPYREITIIYHEVAAVASQAFPVFTEMVNTVNAGFDGFAINNGTGGIGAEIYSNRLGLGPMGDCVDCKFEEFFLSAWSVGDPAMLVDRPANSSLTPPPPPPTSFAKPPVPPPPPLCTTVQLEGTKPPSAPQPPNPDCAKARQPSYNAEPYTLSPLVKATRVYYPDDPSNVYHSYINDHTKFRILHGGTVVTHVHHQHAHQWLQSPNSDQGSYLDSQMISPGASYTLEMVYNGGGNRNKVVGDSIFHCHFYPHFAAGMWAMWRTHDVFEAGTFVYPQGKIINGKDVSGQAVPGSRALPDGEVITGAPTPAMVPIPTIPMAPLPAYAQIQNNVTVPGLTVNGLPTHFGGQVVIGGTCGPANTINGLTVIGGCNPGDQLNGTVINSQFNGTVMTGQFQPSPGNALLNPGFPYFIPGIAGARAPHPPLDFAPDGAGFWDGGLPRHIVGGGTISYERHTQYDWSKDLEKVTAAKLPETGTPVELAAINFFKQRCHQTSLPDGTPSNCLLPTPFGFIVNGLPIGPQPGAPFADPAVKDDGTAIDPDPSNPQHLRRYKAAAIQLNVTFNKKGWHFPQQRMLSLWDDVAPTLGYNGSSGRQPEPLFFRGNSGDIIEYWHTNLVPNYYLVDDFQVRTPTDILGQHIHLVKFDVTSSDGAGNGFNYEDGTFSPQEVQETITAINKAGGLIVSGQPPEQLTPKMPPKEILDCANYPNDPRCKPCLDNWTPTYRPQCQSWMGAQTTIQRWYLDPLLDDSGVDRTLRTVFTHDHFGPSTHQQVGLYAGLVVEPSDSTWKNSEDGTVMGRPANLPPVRPDGGPTSWKADIWTGPNNSESYREFLMEFQDLQLAYASAAIGATNPLPAPNPNPSLGWRDPLFAINPARDGSGNPFPRLISTGNLPPTGTQSVNYLNEPIAWRLGSMSTFPAPSKFSDLSYAYDNSIQGTVNPLDNPDPKTPLMRAYQNDNVQVRLLVGAHVFAHQFNLEGPTWFAEPSWKNSGYRSAQAMGLSEHFELLFHVPSSSAPSTGRQCPDGMSQANCADYLYSPSLDESGIDNGLWGLFRAYDPTKVATKLQALPNNPVGAGANVTYSTCPASLPAPAVRRVYNIFAVTAQRALVDITPVDGDPSKGQLVFNDRGGSKTALVNKLGIMYVRKEDLKNSSDPNNPDYLKLKPGVPIEPLVLRANAGDCIEVNLTNALPAGSDVFQQDFPLAPPLTGPPFPTKASRYVGLHPQLLSYDAAQSNGINVGWNSQGQKDQVVLYGQTITYQWYAGKIDRANNGNLTYTPVEFGSLNLFPSDPVFQHINGLFGSMVIEPQGSTWKCGDASPIDCYPPAAGASPTTRTSATVTLPDNTKFREFALMISDSMQISQTLDQYNNVVAPPNSSAVNYRTEPWSFRYANNTTQDFSCMLSNQLIALAPKDPKTPIFRAELGDQVRFRMTHPFGTGNSQVVSLHGHVWQRNPYQNDSKEIGDNALSQWLGSRDNHGSSDHFDLVVNKAGGKFKRAGDYLYTVFLPSQSMLGAWGIFRVGHSNVPMNPNFACEPIPKAPAYVAPKKKTDIQERFNRQPTNTAKPN